MQRQNSYSYEDLLRCGHGQMFGEGNPQLPLPPLLMFDRIISITEQGGTYNNGEMIAELDIHPDLWFFQCHFESDAVMPGCLGLDAMWQLVGFFLGWMGGLGRGRALGADNIKFSGQVLPSVEKVTYIINIKRTIMRQLVVGIADAVVLADGQEIYNATDLRVGLFRANGL